MEEQNCQRRRPRNDLSLEKIINQVDRQRKIPELWQEMAIRALHKKGEKAEMANKRGLFLTNNISKKIYERVVKRRNEDEFNNGITEWNMGGVKGRSAIDIVIIMTSIIEMNNYLGKDTIITVTDAEKCFDRICEYCLMAYANFGVAEQILGTVI